MNFKLRAASSCRVRDSSNQSAVRVAEWHADYRVGRTFWIMPKSTCHTSSRLGTWCILILVERLEGRCRQGAEILIGQIFYAGTRLTIARRNSRRSGSESRSASPRMCATASVMGRTYENLHLRASLLPSTWLTFQTRTTECNQPAYPRRSAAVPPAGSVPRPFPRRIR